MRNKALAAGHCEALFGWTRGLEAMVLYSTDTSGGTRAGQHSWIERGQHRQLLGFCSIMQNHLSHRGLTRNGPNTGFMHACRKPRGMLRSSEHSKKEYHVKEPGT